MSTIPTYITTIAARVSLDLRADLEQIAQVRRAAGETRGDGQPIDLSTVIRQALRGYADGVIPGNGHAAPSLLDNGAPGTTRRTSGPTERAAALKVAARAGSVRRRALELCEAAGGRGLTPDEVHAALEPAPQNSVARRVTDLYQGGLIEPVPPPTIVGGDHPGDDVLDGTVVRKTRAGAWGTVYRITGAGILALTDKRNQEARP